MGNDLSLKDIRFLRAVRDINANPEAYERTEKGEAPASTGAIIDASDLSESEVRYRMGGSRRRGFEEMGLTIVHEAEFDEETKMFGAKSVELTQEGIDELTEFEEENDVFDDGGEDDGVPEVVKQLRGRVEKLEKRSVGGGSDGGDFSREIKSLRNDIERLETKIDGAREDPWGALDDDVVEHTKGGIERVNAVFYILQTVFGIDVERRVEEGSYPSNAAVEAERVEIAEVLNSAEFVDGNDSSGREGQEQAQDQVVDGGTGESESESGSGSDEGPELTPPQSIRESDSDPE
jgi:hypothetical protein